MVLVEKSENKLVLNDKYCPSETNETEIVIDKLENNGVGIKMMFGYVQTYYYAKDKEDIKEIILFLLNCL